MVKIITINAHTNIPKAELFKPEKMLKPAYFIINTGIIITKMLIPAKIFLAFSYPNLKYIGK